MDKYVPLVSVHRGNMVESYHYGAACVVNHRSQVIAAWGDIDQPVYPRSAIKSLQALPLVESGAAAAFQVSEAELALACASHNGEVAHTDQITHWLSRLGLDDRALSCGPQKPSEDSALKQLYQQNLPVRSLHNNCSGKHSGFLTFAKHMGWSLENYADRQHPVQQAVREAVAEMAECDLSQAPEGIDGCGIPVVALPLQKIALAAARMAACAGGLPVSDIAHSRQVAATKIIHAQMAHPFNIAGTDRYCSRAMQAAQGQAFLKIGAEGIYFAGIPSKGLGISVKVSDGAFRAAEVIVGVLLHRYGGFEGVDGPQLDSLISPKMHNWVGTYVGHLAFIEP